MKYCTPIHASSTFQMSIFHVYLLLFSFLLLFGTFTSMKIIISTLVQVNVLLVTAYTKSTKLVLCESYVVNFELYQDFPIY